jgi:hypothetical protein
MNRIACILVLCAAFACAIWVTRAVAFTTDVESSTNPGEAAGYVDPDDQPMPGLLQVAPDIQDYQGTASQPSPDQSGWIFSIAPKR